MIFTPSRRFGAIGFILIALGFSSEALTKQNTPQTANHRAHPGRDKPTVSNLHGTRKQAYPRKSASSSLPDLRKYPSGTPRKKAFIRTVMPYITKQNASITADRNWLIAKQYQKRWAPSETARLKAIAGRYKVAWNGNTRSIPWRSLLERVDIIPGSMIATMAAAESGWGTSSLARQNNNLFGMKCGRNCSTKSTKGYSHFGSVDESVQAYVSNLNTHPAYNSFRKSRAQLRHQDQQLTASNMIHKLKGYSTLGNRYNDYLLTMYRSNQHLLTTH